MGIRRGIVLISLIIVAFLMADANCVFGPNHYYGVMSVRGNRVFIRHDRWYTVGKLPEGWHQLKTGVKAASWYNSDHDATISTDVFCERSVDDRPLSVVAGQIAGAIEDRRVTDNGEFMLDGRGALRQTVNGMVDGVALTMDLVVLKKNNCAFDFVTIAPSDRVAAVTPVFEDFFNAFHFE